MTRIPEPHLGVAGLYYNANPHVAVPEGALQFAAECVVRAKGRAESRPGFKASTNVSALTSIEALIPYNDSVLHIGSAAAKTYWPPSTHVLTESGVELPWSRDEIRGLETRKNLYLTTSNALRKLTSSADTVADVCGALPPALVSASVANGTALATGFAVAYVAVLERTDPNGLVVTSAPSGRLVVFNGSGVTKDATLEYAWSHASVGDTVKVFRTVKSTNQTTPDKKYFLCKTIVLAATSGADTFADAVLEENLGAALYTNDNEPGGGITRGNFRPPRAAALALYKGSLILANITNPPRITLRFKESGDIATATGIGTRTYTGTRTNGSSNITSLSSTTGLKVGMLIKDTTNWSGSAPVRVTAIVSTTVTVNATWNGSTAAASMIFCDAIQIGGEYFRTDSAGVLLKGLTSALGTTLGRTSASTTVFGLGNGTVYSLVSGTPPNGDREVLIEGLLNVSASQITISATHGSEYDPALPEISATAQNLNSEVLQNVVAWTKTEQPEHFVLVDYQFVGNAQTPILAAFTAGDSVWLLKGKGDGIYRFSGTGELNGFRVDHVDVTTWLLHGSLACALDESVFAWTSKGLVQVDEAGVVEISKPALGDSASPLLGLSHAVSGPGTYAVANAKDREVVFGLPDADFSGVSSVAVVLNTRNRALTQWFSGTKSFRCACYDPSTQLLMFGASTSGQPAIERAFSDPYITSDLEFAITVSAVSGTSVTINGGSGWTPVVGDAVEITNGVYARVITVGDATHFTIDYTATYGALGTGATRAFKAFQALIGWTSQASRSPATSKRFREWITHFGAAAGLRDWSILLSAMREGGAFQATLNYSLPYDIGGGGRDHRAIVHEDAATGTQLVALISITQACAQWAIDGYTLVYEPLSTRVNA